MNPQPYRKWSRCLGHKATLALRHNSFVKNTLDIFRLSLQSSWFKWNNFVPDKGPPTSSCPKATSKCNRCNLNPKSPSNYVSKLRGALQFGKHFKLPSTSRCHGSCTSKLSLYWPRHWFCHMLLKTYISAGVLAAREYWPASLLHLQL